MSKKKKILLVGSVPMSLSELQMAPAMIGAFVKRRGHDFSYQDINLELFDFCKKNHDLYVTCTEFLQDINKLTVTNSILETWEDFIVEKMQDIDILLVNVFSVFSQIPALRIINLCRSHVPQAKILMGGIGSHKQIMGGINQFNTHQISAVFPVIKNTTFGEICYDNHLIDDWQSTVGLEVLEKWLPQRVAIDYDQEFEFDDYKIDRYQWPATGKSIPMLGSHGCVRQCSFCDVIKHFPRYSFIEADALTKSIIKTYQQTGIYQVQFMDSLVNGSMTNFLQLLKNLAHAREQEWLPDRFSWSGTYICRPRSKLLDEIHQQLAPSGVDNLVIGVETGSDRVRFEMEKKFTNDDLLCELNAFRQHGVRASALFFPSWPTETLTDFHETLDLFSSLAEFGQCGTLDSVQLGANGFALIDGTPIDRDKDKFGLRPGPLPWLWQCDTNPALTFWETIRRRLLMAEWCEMHGIRLENENRFRRYLAFNLQQHRSALIEYSGNLPQMINTTDNLPLSTSHRLSMDVINSGDRAVTMILSLDDHQESFVCIPGVTPISFTFQRMLGRQQTLTVTARFDKDHRTAWQTYDSGDYYDSRGVYLDSIFLDHSDITYRAWNQMFDLNWTTHKDLPSDYDQHLNLRCLTSGMELSATMPSYHSPHKYLLEKIYPGDTKERYLVNARINNLLDEFLR